MMNEEELRTLILSHYENESQTLTTGAEYNFLKFKQLIGVISEEENIRLQDINAIYVRNLRLKGMGNNQMAQMLDQMEVLNKTLLNIGQHFLGK